MQLPVSHFSQLQLSTGHKKRLFHYCVFSRCRGNVSTQLFPSNGCCTIACLHRCYLVVGLHVTVCFESNVTDLFHPTGANRNQEEYWNST
jgi:hypothetical protein